MTTSIPIPQSPAVDQRGYPTREWYLYWQQPEFQQINVNTPITVAMGGTGLSSGVSGGVLAFSASGTLVSSGELSQYQIVFGGGAGRAPQTAVGLGTSSSVLMGNPSGYPQWFGLQNTDSVSWKIDPVSATLSATINAGSLFRIQGNDSVAVQGTPGEGLVQIALKGDAAAPGNTLYYGTGPTGTKGWNTVASALLGSGSVTLTTAANGVTTFSLPVPTGDLSGAWPGSQVVSTHLTNPLPVAQGGTAQGSLTAHAVLLGEGTAGVGNAPTGTAGALLVDQGASADPAFKALSGDATLSGAGALTLAASGVTAGSYGDATHWPQITLDAKGRATAAQNIALPLLQGYIDGLQMQWVSGTAVTVSSGTAYIPGLGTYLQSNAAINLTGLSLTASTWYHLYLYSNAGTPAVECVTTAPVLYYGTAYQKTGDATRRYIGSIKTSASNGIMNFDHSTCDDSVYWKWNINNDGLFVLNNGAATVNTVFSCASGLPITATRAYPFFDNSAASLAEVSSGDLGAAATTMFYIRQAPTGSSLQIKSFIPIYNQSLAYQMLGTPAAGTGLECYIAGYQYAR